MLLRLEVRQGGRQHTIPPMPYLQVKLEAKTSLTPWCDEDMLK